MVAALPVLSATVGPRLWLVPELKCALRGRSPLDWDRRSTRDAAARNKATRAARRRPRALGYGTRFHCGQAALWTEPSASLPCSGFASHASPERRRRWRGGSRKASRINRGGGGSEEKEQNLAKKDLVADLGDVQLRRLFSSLHASLRPGASSVFQFYTTPQLRATAVAAASSCGFGETELLIDLPHATRARKLFLCTRASMPAGMSQSAHATAAHGTVIDGTVTDGTVTRTPSPHPVCPIAWPFTASCLCASRWLTTGQSPPVFRLAWRRSALHARERCRRRR